jgi:hypothetical protein
MALRHEEPQPTELSRQQGLQGMRMILPRVRPDSASFRLERSTYGLGKYTRGAAEPYRRGDPGGSAYVSRRARLANYGCGCWYDHGPRSRNATRRPMLSRRQP